MSDAKKLENVFILAETEDELVRVLRILETKRPNLRWNGGGTPTDYNPHFLPIKIGIDQPEFDRIQQVEGHSTYWEDTYGAKIQKIEDILGDQTPQISKTSEDICACNGPSVVTGFTTIYEVCKMCKKVKQ